MSKKTIRIFISSPGDVKAERQAARQVIEHLQIKYVGRLSLHSIFWEDMPIDVCDAFQVGIDKALVELEKVGGIDIAIFILWSRLGSPTIELKAANGLREYPSGTVREWEYMMELREKNSSNGEEGRPTIFLYTRKDEESFKRLLNKCNDEERRELDLQKDAVDAFIREKCKDPATGKNTGAHLDYRDTGDGDRNDGYELPNLFKPKLRAHLMGYLDRIAGLSSGRPVWDVIERDCLPFRGLEVFDVEHHLIFYGREDEIVSIRAQLKAQSENGCAFVLIIGPSGSGKSSLGRAGVIPEIRELELDQAYGPWRYLTVKPSQLGNDLVTGLIRAFSTENSWSGLKEWQAELEEARKDKFEEFKILFKTRVVDALKPKVGDAPTERLILLLDQLEEIFSDESVTEKTRNEFFGLIERLARSGYVWVIATVRSDFYEHCQNVESLTAMRHGEGTFDLTLPTTDALRRVITGPASLAGLKFEERDGRSLSDEILDQASQHKELLPLVEYLLLELCERRTIDGKLTFEAFGELEGVEGALRQRCESTFNSLSTAAKESLDDVLSELVTLSGDGKDTIVRRTVKKELFAQHQAQVELVRVMEQARLFTASSGSDGQGVVTVVHETLLRVWPRAAEMIEGIRVFLRTRSRVESWQKDWEADGKIESKLLPAGPFLDEATHLLKAAPYLVKSFITQRYIADSQAYHERIAKEKRTLALIDQLMRADPTQILPIVDELKANPEFAARSLKPLLTNPPSTPEEQRLQLHSRIALATHDEEQIEPLLTEFLCGKVPFLLPIRTVLAKYASLLSPRFTELLYKPAAEAQQRFRAAVALAVYLPQKELDLISESDWGFVAEQLVSQNAEHQPMLREALRSSAGRLIPELKRLFSDNSATDSQKLSAANAIADYAETDRTTLTDLITRASPSQFDVLFPLISFGNTKEVIQELSLVAAKLPQDELSTTDRISFGQRRANAAVTLLRLGEPEKVFPVFEWTDDPEALSQFIFRCKPRGVGVEPLLDLLDLAVAKGSVYVPKDSRYAILLAIGEYEPGSISKERRERLVSMLSDWYINDPNSGVHGASGWLLRQLGESEIANCIDQTEVPYSPGREWFTLAIPVLPDESQANRVTVTLYYTFVVFLQGKFLISSPLDQPDRLKGESQHEVTLSRPYAILDRQVAFEELVAFSPQYSGLMSEKKAVLRDAGYGPGWYDSVAFCRWLGIQMGLSEMDQSYADPEALGKEEYPRDEQVTWAPKNWPLDLSKRGFRLPTESEWEISARGGSRTSYGFGSEVSLLDRFGWFAENSEKKVYPGKQKRPSLRGLFDMHGNLSEWTHDWYSDDFGKSSQTDPVVSDLGNLGMFRVYRGGGWNKPAALCRSAVRGRGQPTHSRNDIYGFRVALCCPSGIPLSPEADK
jgi:formylglycine-generating enzyme required for sulfatase activity